MSKQGESESCLAMSDSLRPYGLYSPRNSPGQNTEWVAFPFSRGSSQPRDQTQVSSIAGGFFTSWVTREAHGKQKHLINEITTSILFYFIFIYATLNGK